WLNVAQENAGHSDIGTTMHYRQVAQTDRFEATHLLSLKKKVCSKNKDKA
ncbi:MAG: recombinase, partial [Legionellales bacterium]|nr:recombinase [Legionellales bacterium]